MVLVLFGLTASGPALTPKLLRWAHPPRAVPAGMQRPSLVAVGVPWDSHIWADFHALFSGEALPRLTV